MFGAVVNGLNAYYPTVCSNRVIQALGMLVTANPGWNSAACWLAGGALAALNYASYVLNDWKSQGDWQWNKGSGAARRAVFTLPANSSDAWLSAEGAGNGVWLSDTLYLNHDPKIPAWFETAAEGMGVNYTTTMCSFDASNTSKRSEHATVLWHTYVLQNNGTTSVSGDKEGILDSLETLTRFDGKNMVFSASAPWKNQTLAKRDDWNGIWASYNDYGYNPGYFEDIVEWNELKKGGAYQSIENILYNHDQPCNDQQCYSINPKWCLAIGFSNRAGDSSAFVGEVYDYGFGGVDGQCQSL